MIKFSRDNVYVKMLPKEKVAYIGISESHIEKLEDIDIPSLPLIDKICIDDEFITIETPNAAETFYMPISGEIVEVNDEILANPHILHDDPEGDGWICKIIPENKDELDDLLSGSEYRDYLEEVSKEEEEMTNEEDYFEDEE